MTIGMDGWGQGRPCRLGRKKGGQKERIPVEPEASICGVTEGSKNDYDVTLRCLTYESLRLVQGI